MENFMDNLIDALKDLQLIIGIIIGFCSSIVLDVKSYINDEYEDINCFYDLIEKLYIDIRFNDNTIFKVVNKIKNDEQMMKIIPNYFKYAIKINDFESIEAIIVNSYLNKINSNMNKIQRKFILIVLHVTFIIIAIIVFMGITIYLPVVSYFCGKNFLVEKIHFFDTRWGQVVINIFLMILGYKYLTKIHTKVISKAQEKIFNIIIEKDKKEDYTSILDKNKLKYNELKNTGYKLRLK